MTVLLDTNVVSYFLKCDPAAELFKSALRKSTVVISFVTVGEIYEGAYRSAWDSRKKARLLSVLGRYHILEYTPAICESWGWLRSVRKANPISENDAWIAATALAYDIPLATHNKNDFQDIRGLKLV